MQKEEEETEKIKTLAFEMAFQQCIITRFIPSSSSSLSYSSSGGGGGPPHRDEAKEEQEKNECQYKIGCKLHREWWEGPLLKLLSPSKSLCEEYKEKSAKFGFRQILPPKTTKQKRDTEETRNVLETLCSWGNHPILHKLMLDRQHRVDLLGECVTDGWMGSNRSTCCNSCDQRHARNISIAIYTSWRKGSPRFTNQELLATILHEMAHTEVSYGGHNAAFWDTYAVLWYQYRRYDVSAMKPEETPYYDGRYCCVSL